MFKKLICKFTDGNQVYTIPFRAFTKKGMLKKAAAYQEANGLACLAMQFI